jgi:hypothetical protein
MMDENEREGLVWNRKTGAWESKVSTAEASRRSISRTGQSLRQRTYDMLVAWGPNVSDDSIVAMADELGITADQLEQGIAILHAEHPELTVPKHKRGEKEREAIRRQIPGWGRRRKKNPRKPVSTMPVDEPIYIDDTSSEPPPPRRRRRARPQESWDQRFGENLTYVRQLLGEAYDERQARPGVARANLENALLALLNMAKDIAALTGVDQNFDAMRDSKAVIQEAWETVREESIS